MSGIPRLMCEEVLLRARGRCEYCQLAQIGQEAIFHIDHVVPRAAGGPTTIGNLALACVSCSLRKGARQAGIDPDSNESVPLFNPRLQFWNDQFRWDGVRVVGQTPIGRATVDALAMNRSMILAIRHEEMARGRHPPSEVDSIV